jgi:glycosyltransferase involved in cell wall biosynthesis
MVSIVVPVKDRVLLLQETLYSVRNQTYPNWELLLVDDGSNHSTLTILHQWASKDRRIRLICRNGTPHGANRCRNIGLRASNREYLIFLDSDDCLEASCLENRVGYMVNNPDIDFAVFGCHVFRVTPNDSRLYYNCHTGRGDLVRFLAWDNPWGTTCPIWRRRALQRLHWDEALPSLQDWDFHVRALITGLRHKKVPSADWYYRLPAPERPSTSRQIRLPDHLVSHERVLATLWRRLRETGLLQRESKIALAGIHFSLAVSWAASGQRRNATSLWQAALVRNLVTKVEYFEGLAYLRVYLNKFARRAFNLYLNLRWPPTLLHRRSPTRYRASSLI